MFIVGPGKATFGAKKKKKKTRIMRGHGPEIVDII